VSTWLQSDPRLPRWSLRTRQRIAQGLLSTLRDFGILEAPRGSPRKRFAAPRLSMRGFAYIALRERERCTSDRALLSSPVWQRYLLTPASVRNLFLEADRLGLLRYSEAGSAVRVDWLLQRLEEVPDVLAA